MIYVGIDDTDTLDDPGTNQLARHLVRELAPQFCGRLIVRHQLLEDPRVPCTKKNGCASILFEPVTVSDTMSMDLSPPLGGEGTREGGTATLINEQEQRSQNYFLSNVTSGSGDRFENSSDPFFSSSLATLINRIRDLIVPWCPKASDPGFCVATAVPQSVIEWGLRCKRELVTQAEAHKIAADVGIHLEGLGGTQDGVIGALAAIGLMATKNDGRVVHCGSAAEDWYDVTGCLAVDDIQARGIDEIRAIDSGELLFTGTVDVGKRLRPNYREGKIVLFVTRNEQPHWEAVRVV